MPSRPLSAAALLLGVALLPGCIIHIDGTGDWTDSYADGYRNDGRNSIVRGNGVRASESRDVEAFDAVRLSGSVDVKVRVGEAQSVTVRGDENLLEHVRAEVQGGVLEVWMEPGRYRRDSELMVEVGVPDLVSFALAGSGDAWIEGVDRDDFSLSIDGSGDVVAGGRTDSLSVAIRGSGDMRLAELEARSATVTISGSGHVRLSVSDQLSVRVSGSGDVVYSGDPALQTRVSGAGDVRRAR